MHCPKCHHEQGGQNTECVRCGVIFSKFAAAQKTRREKRPPDQNGVSVSQDQARHPVLDFFLYTNTDNHLFFLVGRGIVWVVLIIWGAKFVISPIEDNYASESFMHLINLPFHEAGHIFFRFLGSFMASLGGTLGQFLMPMICFAVLLIKTRDTFGASVCLWWFGQNFLDIAPYVNDARSLSLPLLGGNVGHSSPYGFHDWQYLLTETGLLRYDHLIAKLCLTIGTVILLASILWGGILLIKQYKTLEH